MGNKAVSSEEKHLIKILEKINLDPQNLVALFGYALTLKISKRFKKFIARSKLFSSNLLQYCQSILLSFFYLYINNNF